MEVDQVLCAGTAWSQINGRGGDGSSREIIFHPASPCASPPVVFAFVPSPVRVVPPTLIASGPVLLERRTRLKKFES